jgi:hypothetical protein
MGAFQAHPTDGSDRPRPEISCGDNALRPTDNSRPGTYETDLQHHYRQIEYTGDDRCFHYPSLLFDGQQAHLTYRDGDNRHTHQSVRYLRLSAEWLMPAD